MLGAVDRELFLGHPIPTLVGNRDLFHIDEALLTSVPVVQFAGPFDDRLEVFVNIVHAARRVHPADAVIETLIDEELTPRHRAVCIQTFRTKHLRFGPEEKRCVRIDQEQGMMRRRVGWRDRDTV